MSPRALLPLGALVLCATACAQDAAPASGFTCLANDGMEHHWATVPGALEAAMRAKAELDRHTAGFVRERDGDPYIVSVVVHIIHNNGTENISDAQVEDAIRVLNEDFNLMNPDRGNVRPAFLDLVADVGIEFRLARKDPQGNCTNGITRTVSRLTYAGDNGMVQLVQWPRDRYLNVWVAASANGAAGYSYYPASVNAWPERDGIVMLHTYMGSIGTSEPYRSRVLAHEVGHWLNLKHCWGDSNEAGLESNCGDDDDVADTPLTKGWTSCFLSGNSCGSALDNVENFMEYAYCQRMFTHGQADRMVAALTSPIAQRDRLWQPATLQATGVLDAVDLCVAKFIHGPAEVCAGTTVRFTDESYHNVSWRSWSFPGGVPDTSSSPNPVIRYDVPGTYPVSLTVGDGTTSRTTATDSLVVVLPSTGTTVPFLEDFDTINSLPEGGWVTSDRDGDGTFSLTSAAAFSGTNSVRLANTSQYTGRIDDLRSGTFDMGGSGGITVSFRHAFARRSPGNDDRLRVHVSNDCGTTWSLRLQLRGSTNLPTASDRGGNFTPASAGEWAQTVVSNISPAYRTANFRVRFEFESGGGNHLYLDDININGSPVGLDGPLSDDIPAMVVPNPAGDEAQAMFSLRNAGPVRIELLDALGRSLDVPHDGILPAGPHLVDLPVAGLRSGLYLVRISHAEHARTLRFTVR